MTLTSGKYRLTITKLSYTLAVVNMSGYEIEVENSRYALSSAEVLEYLNEYYGTDFRMN